MEMKQNFTRLILALMIYKALGNGTEVVHVFNCNKTSDHSTTLLDPHHCNSPKPTSEKVVRGELVFIPDKEEHDAKGCELTIVAQGSICGWWSIQYPNLKTLDHFSLTRTQCLTLHKGERVVLDNIPVRTSDKTGLMEPLSISGGKVGHYQVKIEIGTTDADGYCTGEKLIFHDYSYDGERATLMVNVTLYEQKVKLIDLDNLPRQTECNKAAQMCLYPGGVLAWQERTCRAHQAYTGPMVMSSDNIIRSLTEKDREAALQDCKLRDGKTPCKDSPAVKRSLATCWKACLSNFVRPSTTDNYERCAPICEAEQKVLFTLRRTGKKVEIPDCDIEVEETNSAHFFFTKQMTKDLSKDDKLILALREKGSELAQKNQASLETLTKALRREICDLKVSEARKAAEVAHKNPTSTAFIKRGLVAVIRGELLMTARCDQTLAHVRKTKDCYHDLPISFRGENVFQHSIYHHVITSSTKTSCSPPPIYYIKKRYQTTEGERQNDYRKITANLPETKDLVSTEDELYMQIDDFLKNHENYARQQQNFKEHIGEITSGTPHATMRKIFGEIPKLNWLTDAANIIPFAITVVIIIAGLTLACCCCCPPSTIRATLRPTTTPTITWEQAQNRIFVPIPVSTPATD